MSLRLRLTLTLAGVLWLLVLGLGAALYALTAADLRVRFTVQLQTLAQQYAQLALQPDSVRLREPPPNPLHDELEGHEVYLLAADGHVVDSLGADAGAPVIPAAQLKRSQSGTFSSGGFSGAQPGASFDLPASPESVLLGRQRAAVLYPIFALNGNFGVAYTLALVSADRVGQQSLARLRTTILVWALLATLLALVAGDRLAVWLSRPLREVAATAHAVGQGALQRRIPRAGGRDEIGGLKRDLNAMLERLETLVAAQRRFTADAAHDLRTPLSVLRTELEVSLRRPREAAEYRDTLARLLERVEALSKLAEDLLTLSKLEAGQERPLEALLLRDTLEGTIDTTQRVASQRNLEFVVDLPTHLEVLGDASTLPRLVANLLDNAAKAARTRFGLRAELQSKSVRLSVWDDGEGIKPELRARLFQRFAKGETSSGAGLGLAIAQQIASAHGAVLTPLEGTGLVGATFQVELTRVSLLRSTLETRGAA
jgi:signal transduction histidine kinase